MESYWNALVVILVLVGAVGLYWGFWWLRTRYWPVLYVVEKRKWLLFWTPIYGGKTRQPPKVRLQQHLRDRRFGNVGKVRIRVVARVSPEEVDTLEQQLIEQLVAVYGDQIMNVEYNPRYSHYRR